MRKLALFAVVGSSIGWAVLSSIGGCSSATPATETKDAGKGKSSTSSSSSGDDNTSSSSSSTSSTSSSSSGSTPTDAGSDAAPVTAANALKITCGAKECIKNGTDDEDGRCCWANGDATKATCAVDNQCNGDNFEIACDDKVDCKAGVCCWGDGQTLCGICADVDRPNKQPDIQLCKTDTECLAGKCALKTCKMGDQDDTGGLIAVKISVCGTPTNCQ